MDLRLLFSAYPRNCDGKTPLWPYLVSLDKLLYFTLEPRLDKPMLTSDCGSNVSLLEYSCSRGSEGTCYRGLFGTLDGISIQILQELECMESVQEDANGNTKLGGGAQRWRERSRFWRRRGFLCWRRGTAPLEESVAIAQTHWNTLERHVLPHKMSIGTEGLINDVYEFRASPQRWVPRNEPYRWQCGWQCSFGVALVLRPLSILLMLKSFVPATTLEILEINLEYWSSYEDLEECMEPMKQLSLLLESSIEPTIHIILDHFLRLLYQVFGTSPKRHIGACVVFNTFVDTFRQKLLMLLDNVEQFFLWVVVAMLDGRRTSFEWLNLVWENKHKWQNVTYKYKNGIKIYTIWSRRWDGILWSRWESICYCCMSIPFKCGPQAPTLLLGSRAIEAQEDTGMSYIIVWERRWQQRAHSSRASDTWMVEI